MLKYTALKIIGYTSVNGFCPVSQNVYIVLFHFLFMLNIFCKLIIYLNSNP